jgi:hypothetical protein
MEPGRAGRCHAPRGLTARSGPTHYYLVACRLAHDNHPSSSRSLAPGGLWAIASYFNPLGYRTRLANYRIFQRHLGVPLLTVEQGYDGRFELDGRDATILMQIPARDVMWQKERLLNLALVALPPECEIVVWLDADILFDRVDWPQQAVAALDTSVMAQLFSRTCYLPRDVDFSRPLAEQRYLERRSTASGLVGGVLQENSLSTTLETLKVHGMALDYANGHAWAMRRHLLQSVGFYEAMIVGGGDYVFLQAALGQFEAVRKGHGWTSPDSRQYRHFLRWADRFHGIVQGRIGMVPGRHLQPVARRAVGSAVHAAAPDPHIARLRPGSGHRDRHAWLAVLELRQAGAPRGGPGILPGSPGGWPSPGGAGGHELRVRLDSSSAFCRADVMRDAVETARDYYWTGGSLH